MSPDRSREIVENKKDVNRFLKEKDFDGARFAYQRLIECLKQQNEYSGGKWTIELESTMNEYSEFAEIDPLYKKTCDMIFPVIEMNPGILQTDLYKLFSKSVHGNINYALYFATEHSKIKREKKGRTYSIKLW